jgi:hypothetical protein
MSAESVRFAALSRALLFAALVLSLAPLSHAQSPLINRARHLSESAARIATPAGAAASAAAPVVALGSDGQARDVASLPPASAAASSSVVLSKYLGGAPVLEARPALNSVRYTLPIIVNSESNGDSVNSRPFVELVEKGLRYIADKQVFEGTALVGLEREGGDGTSNSSARTCRLTGKHARVDCQGLFEA